MTAPTLIERLLYMADGRTQPELARELMQEAALELARLESQLAGLGKPAYHQPPYVDGYFGER